MRVQIIPGEGGSSIAHFANARVLKALRVRPEVFVVLDGDTTRGDRHKRARERLLEQLSLPPAQVITLQMSEIEGYLFETDALVTVFPDLAPSRAEVERMRAELLGKRDQKGPLDTVLQRVGARYDSDTARRIASVVTTPQQIETDLFSRCRAVLART